MTGPERNLELDMLRRRANEARVELIQISQWVAYAVDELGGPGSNLGGHGAYPDNDDPDFAQVRRNLAQAEEKSLKLIRDIKVASAVAYDLENEG